MAMGNFGQWQQPIRGVQRQGSRFGSNMRAQQRAFEAIERKKIQFDPAKCCFKDGCPAGRKAHFELCTTCHKDAVKKGTFKGKDGVVYPMLQVSESTAEQRKANTMKMVKAASAWRRGPAAQLAIANMAAQGDDQTIVQDEQEYEACLQDMGIIDGDVGGTMGEANAAVAWPATSPDVSMNDGAHVAGAELAQENALAAQIMHLQQREAARQEALEFQQ